MIDAVILAAGRSRRMPPQKLLLPWRGKTVIEHVVEQVLGSRIRHALVVVRSDDRALVDRLANQPVRLVFNPQADSEMLESIRCGLRAIPAFGAGVLIVPADHPGLSATLIDQLIDAFTGSGRPIVVPVCHRRRGHPIIIDAACCTEVLHNFDTIGLRGLLRQHPNRVHEVPVLDPDVMHDMDVPSDYEQARKRAGELAHWDAPNHVQREPGVDYSD